MDRLFKMLAERHQQSDLVVYNADGYTRGPVTDLDLDVVRDTLNSNAFGALLVA